MAGAGWLAGWAGRRPVANQKMTRSNPEQLASWTQFGYFDKRGTPRGSLNGGAPSTNSPQHTRFHASPLDRLQPTSDEGGGGSEGGRGREEGLDEVFPILGMSSPPRDGVQVTADNAIWSGVAAIYLNIRFTLKIRRAGSNTRAIFIISRDLGASFSLFFTPDSREIYNALP